MKLFGQKIATRNVEIIIIPRGNEKDIVFKAAAVLDFSEFEALCPIPKVPKKMYPSGIEKEDNNNPTYKIAISQFLTRRMAWLVITSLKATETLEWETVDFHKPDTWEKWEEELREAQFSPREILRIWEGVKAANCISEEKIEAARQNFLARQEAEAKSSGSQNTEV